MRKQGQPPRSTKINWKVKKPMSIQIQIREVFGWDSRGSIRRICRRRATIACHRVAQKMSSSHWSDREILWLHLLSNEEYSKTARGTRLLSRIIALASSSLEHFLMMPKESKLYLNIRSNSQIRLLDPRQHQSAKRKFEAHINNTLQTRSKQNASQLAARTNLKRVRWAKIFTRRADPRSHLLRMSQHFHMASWLVPISPKPAK